MEISDNLIDKLADLAKLDFEGEEKEWLVSFCKDVLKKEHFDYFIFGHRHLPLDIQLNENSKYINLGDWIKYFSYAELDEQQLQIKYYKH